MRPPRLTIRVLAMRTIACLVLFYNISAMAATCSATGSTLTLPAITLTLQRDRPNGPTGDALSISVGGRYTCSADGTSVSQHQFGINGNISNLNETSYSGRTLYKLGTSGIGYTLLGLSNASADCLASAYIGPGPVVGGVTNSVRLCNSTSGLITPQPLQGGIQVDFFKIGPVTPGTISSTLIGSFVSQINSESWSSPGVNIYSGSITVIEKACSVTTPAITVPMGEVARSAFTGIGSTAGTHDFAIALDCDASTNIKLQLAGTTAGGLPTVLALTASASPPAATGVGVQVLYAGNPVTIGTPITIGTTPTDGPYNLALQARYYQINSVVTAGQADSTATFTITYD
ncbi:fimbrial protein [Acerihabitans sp. TG2]|uniref:fimbrial protein n=1 Tax=Acerihabitans sp. TG2 TaxID=3096008 RepID=UPI002B230B61|nr:fimbrial protein [Acerihabitans sp. TG2]MEA9389678.1 fimbrial protein [Acerihabitans sp. TG2]